MPRDFAYLFCILSEKIENNFLKTANQIYSVMGDKYIFFDI